MIQFPQFFAGGSRLARSTCKHDFSPADPLPFSATKSRSKMKMERWTQQRIVESNYRA
jgi:hypothetical protein